jgi:hypothetical protein
VWLSPVVCQTQLTQVPVTHQILGLSLLVLGLGRIRT